MHDLLQDSLSDSLSGPLLPQLQISVSQVYHLPSNLRRRLFNFLNRWEGHQELLQLLDSLDMDHLVSIQDLRAQGLLGTGQAAAAVDVMEKRLEQKDSVAPRNQLASILLAAGQHQEALHLANQLTQTSPQSIMAWNTLGQIYLALDNLEQAEAAFLQSQQISPNSRPPLLGLMEIHQRRGDPVTSSAYAVRAYTVGEGENLVAVYLVRKLRNFFKETGDINRLYDANQQLDQRFDEELKILRDEVHSELGSAHPADRETVQERVTPKEASAPKPEPLPDLNEIPVSAEERAELTQAVQHYFGFPNLLHAQTEIMACARRDENVLAILPTGAGKSLCYQLPAFMDQAGTTLVISPLIALMKDQVDNLPQQIRHLAIAINSSLDGSELRQAIADTAAGRYRLVYAAPERLTQQSFLHALRHAGINRLVIDEAHCVSVWGHDFRPDYLNITQAHRDLASPPILAMTATAPPRVRQDIERQLFGVMTGGQSQSQNQSQMRLIATDTYRPNLNLSALRVRNQDEKLSALLGLAKYLGNNDASGIIYAGTRRRCEEVAELLRRQGLKADHYHAGVADRSAMQDRFMKGEVQIMVATIAFGMGVDKSDIRFILHYGLADSVEAYYQEAGRAGRDGATAHCVLLHTQSDQSRLTRHAKEDILDVVFLRELYAAVRQLMGQHNPGTVSLDDLSRQLGKDDTPIRVGLSLLEQAALLKRHYDAPYTITMERLDMGASHQSEVFDHFANAIHLRPQQMITRNFLEMAQWFQATVGAGVAEFEEYLLQWQDTGYLRYQTNGRNLLLTRLEAPADAATRIQSLLNQQATIQQQRVTEIVDYARTRQCRHGHLANYLGGEPRPQCEACEHCVASALPDYESDLMAVEDQLRWILRALSENSWGRRNLTRMLRGDPETPDRARHSPAYGTLGFRSDSGLEKLAERLLGAELIAEKHLSLGIALEITAAGRSALHDNSSLAHLAPPPPPPLTEKNVPAPVEIDLSDPVTAACYEKLKDWRMELARAKQVPPYLIASNRVLQEAASSRPQTLENLAQVKGIGPAKITEYGEAILAVIST